jgi:hypothetical protein
MAGPRWFRFIPARQSGPAYFAILRDVKMSVENFLKLC